jgi:hypothetical protein
MELTATVADQLRAAFDAGPDEAQDALRSLYAEQVEVRHVPTLPSDGVVHRARLVEVSTREAAAVRGAIPDEHYGDIHIDADGDRIHVRVAIYGTLITGKTIELVSDSTYTVTDGHIAGIEHHMPPEAMAGWAEVATAGGLRVPDQFTG